MWDWLEYLFSEGLGVLFERWGRFYACFLISFAVAGFSLWLVPGRRLSVAVSAAVVILGTAAGLLWERRSGRS